MRVCVFGVRVCVNMCESVWCACEYVCVLEKIIYDLFLPLSLKFHNSLRYFIDKLKLNGKELRVEFCTEIFT